MDNKCNHLGKVAKNSFCSFMQPLVFGNSVILLLKSRQVMSGLSASNLPIKSLMVSGCEGLDVLGFLDLRNPNSLQLRMKREVVDLLTPYLQQSCSLLISPLLISASKLARSSPSSSLQDVQLLQQSYFRLGVFSNLTGRGFRRQDCERSSYFLAGRAEMFWSMKQFSSLGQARESGLMVWSMMTVSSTGYSGERQSSMYQQQEPILCSRHAESWLFFVYLSKQANQYNAFAQKHLLSPSIHSRIHYCFWYANIHSNSCFASVCSVCSTLFTLLRFFGLFSCLVSCNQFIVMLGRLLNPNLLFRFCNKSIMAQKPQLAVYYVTASSLEQAEKIGSALVQSKLAACTNIVQGIHSVYMWQGKVNKDKEVLMVIKSRLSLLKQIEQKVKSLHSYKVPEVIAMPIVGGSEDYTEWVISNTIQN